MWAFALELLPLIVASIALFFSVRKSFTSFSINFSFWDTVSTRFSMMASVGPETASKRERKRLKLDTVAVGEKREKALGKQIQMKRNCGYGAKGLILSIDVFSQKHI